MTIFGMLLVNNIALDWRTPAQLVHAPWNGGVRFADLVFPWFLLIVGVSIPFSWSAHWKRGQGRAQFLGRALIRAVALVALGCFIDSSIAKTPLFDLDVLQLIGLSYLVAAFFTMLLPTTPRIVLAFSALLAHGAVIQHVHVPGMPTGTFEPNRNVIEYINRAVLARYHLAGLISVVPASALVLLGTFFGDVLRRERFVPLKRLGLVLGWGLVLVGLGVVWSRILPFNKPVWTGSYILLCGGLGAILLGAFYGLLDLFPAWKRLGYWSLPMKVFGSNAILAYVAPILIKLYLLQVWTWPRTHVPLQTAFLHEAERRWGMLDGGWIYTLGYIGICWCFLLILYVRKMFVRV